MTNPSENRHLIIHRELKSKKKTDQDKRYKTVLRVGKITK
jgi:hypothetical protein